MSDWNDPSVPREPRKLWHDAMLLAAALILLASFLLTETPIPPVNRPLVDDVAPLPPKTDNARYAEYIDMATYMVPKLRRPTLIDVARTLGQPPAPDNYARGPVRLGYSVRELDFFGLPLLGYKDAGYALYFDDWNSSATYQYMGPMGEEGLELLRKEVGNPDLGKGWFFPFWRHMWGWIPLLLGAGWGWLQFRRRQRRRAAFGMI